MISELFRWFVGAPQRLPDGYSARAESEPPHRVVCDYLAGMTDAYFYRTYDQTLGSRERDGSVPYPGPGAI
jgi:dGTPase